MPENMSSPQPTQSGGQPESETNPTRSANSSFYADTRVCFSDASAFRPFKSLENTKFPQKSPSVNKQKNENYDNYADATADREMFLRSIDKIKADPDQKQGKGFLLKDQCSLPILGKKVKKKKKPASVAEPKPQPAVTRDETDMFLLAMRAATPLGGKGRRIAQTPQTVKTPPVTELSFAELINAKLQFTLLYSDEYLEGHVADLDEMIMTRLREGQMSPEAHLDLHGLNTFQAFETLKDFIRDAWYKSLRVVLIVTGRGRNSPEGQSILRRKLPVWLTQDPLKRVVLAFCTALPHDGGPGSIYVLLRKFRKKGHIAWDRLPADADLY